MKTLLLFIHFFAFQVFASEFKLVGKSLLEYSIFAIDIYEISYFKAKGNNEAIHLKYLREVEKKYTIQGWQEALGYITKEKPQYKPAFDWIISQSVDMKENDVLKIEKKQNKVTLFKNGEKIASSTDSKVFEIILEPWIGKKPISEKIKKDLLKGS